MGQATCTTRVARRRGRRGARRGDFVFGGGGGRRGRRTWSHWSTWLSTSGFIMRKFLFGKERSEEEVSLKRGKRGVGFSCWLREFTGVGYEVGTCATRNGRMTSPTPL